MNRKTVAILVAAVILAAALGIVLANCVRREEPIPAAVNMPAAPKKGTIILSAAGDCTLGTDPKFSYVGSFNERFKKEGENHAYFFANVAPIFREDTISFVNFEGTLTEETARADKAYTFKGPAHYAKILTEGDIEVVSLANNHTYDFLERGFADTKKALEAENIAYVFKNQLALFSIKDGVASPAEENAEKGENEVYVGYAAFSVWYDDGEVRASIKNAIADLRKRGADLVFISCHWGLEGENYPYEVQRNIGRYAIDMGADGVFGHHPHVIQGIETYKGKEIVYSMGNFCFGGNHNPSDKDCFIYQLSFETLDGKLTGEWKSKIIPCRISSVKYTNDYKPTPLEGEDAERFMARLEKYRVK